jgi:hypothetical protein
MKNNPQLINELTKICGEYGYTFRAWPSKTDPTFLTPHIHIPDKHPEYQPNVYIRETSDYEISNFDVEFVGYGAKPREEARKVIRRLSCAFEMVCHLEAALAIYR